MKTPLALLFVTGAIYAQVGALIPDNASLLTSSGAVTSSSTTPSYVVAPTTTAIERANDARTPIHIPAGLYPYSGSPLVITVPVQIDIGVNIACTRNNIVFANSVTAPAARIFASGCEPRFSGNTIAFPEWWGAVGDYTGTPGKGTDNTAAIQAAIDSGVSSLSFGAGNYRYTSTLTSTRISFVMAGVSRDVSALILDNAANTTQDSIYQRGGGGIVIRDLRYVRAQPATAGACLHIQDTYSVQVSRTKTGVNCWNGIFVDGETQDTNQIYIENNQIYGALNDGIYAYGHYSERCPKLCEVVDLFIESQNYIELSRHAGVELNGSVSGTFITDNVIYHAGYGIYIDNGAALPHAPNDIKIRGNDIDSNSTGNYFHNLNNGHFQQNWVGTDGPTVFRGGGNIVAGGNNYDGAHSNLTIDGVANFASAGDSFTGQTAPVLIENGANNISITGATSLYSTGAFVTFAGRTSSNLTIGVTTGANQTALNSTTVPSHLNVIMPDASNNNVVSSSAIPWGQSNSVSSAQAGAAGYGNLVFGYAGAAIGQYNTQGGSFSQTRGLGANDFGRGSVDCWAGGNWLSSRGIRAAQTCELVLQAATHSKIPTEMTANGTTPDTHNCINIPKNASFTIEGTLTAQDIAASRNRVSVTGIAGLLYRDSGDAIWQQAAPGVANGVGTGAGIVPTLTADAVNECLKVMVTAPNADLWHWVFRVTTTENVL